MTPLFRKFIGIHWPLLATILALMAWGVWAIYNASSFREGTVLAGKWRDQVQWGAVGLVVFFGAALIDYKWLRWGALLMYIAGIAGLVAVKVFGMEINDKGSISYISIGGMTFQPSQLAITATIALLAVILGDLHRIAPVFRYHWLRLMVAGIVAAVPMLMVLKEPDLGSAAVYGPVVVSMLLVGSIPFRYLITLFLCVMCVLPIAYYFGLKPYQKARVEVFADMLMNRKVDTLGDAYMASYIQIAVASAGFEGKGPLAAKAIANNETVVHRSFFSETEAISDFVYAVIVEEFGFRGGLAQIAAMAVLTLLCTFVAFYARDQLGRLLAVGVTALMFAHAMQHMGMNILMMPITGLPLPFTSYGGLFLVTCLFLMGMVQSVWVHRNISPVKETKKKRGSSREEAEDSEFDYPVAKAKA